MQLTAEQDVAVSRGIDRLRQSINLGWGVVESARAPTEPFLLAVDEYLESSAELSEIFANIFEDDGNSASSARLRLAWLAAGDMLVFRALALVAAADPSQAEGTADLLRELATDQLIPTAAAELSSGRDFQAALVVIAQQTFHDVDRVEAGVRGQGEVSGASGSAQQVGRPFVVVDRILADTTTSLLRVFGGSIAQAIFGDANLMGTALDQLGDGGFVPTTGRLATRAAATLHRALQSLRMLVDPSLVPELVRLVSAHRSALSGLGRHVVNNAYREAELKGRCDDLIAKLPSGMSRTIVAEIDEVEASYRRWNRWDRVVSGSVRWAVRPFRHNPIVLVLLIAVAIAEAGVIAYAAWDHLDSPQLPFHSFAKSVPEVLA